MGPTKRGRLRAGGELRAQSRMRQMVVLPTCVSISPFHRLDVSDNQALAFPVGSNANPTIDERTNHVLENWAFLVDIAFRCRLFPDDNPAVVQIKGTENVLEFLDSRHRS